MHVQDGRHIHPGTHTGADFALRLPITMGVNDVEATAPKRWNESWKQSIVSDVDIASETVHVHAIHRFVSRHLPARRALVTSIRSEHVDFVAPCSQLLRDVLADALYAADHGRVVRHELSNLQAV